MALSVIVGIPNGRFSSVPGLGIQTRLVDFAFWDSLSLATSLSLWCGVRDFTPSTLPFSSPGYLVKLDEQLDI